jgi:exopolysaccharide production protein ExoY
MNTPPHFRRQATRHNDWRAGREAHLPHAFFSQSLPLGGITKRIIDLAIASFALILFLPLFGLVAIAIISFDGAPVLYRHPRVGCGRRPFLCLKFRTMVANGEETLRRHLESSPAAAKEWAESRKLKFDPRVTVVGGVLRKFSLDELPQLINVIRGEMSIVGPRPIVTDELRLYGPNASYYLMARPGLTGPWQVRGRSDEKYEDRVALDRAYVENWSLWKDTCIMLKTVPAILNPKGSY